MSINFNKKFYCEAGTYRICKGEYLCTYTAKVFTKLIQTNREFNLNIKMDSSTM